jgi:hypothetical protein
MICCNERQSSILIPHVTAWRVSAAVRWRPKAVAPAQSSYVSGGCGAMETRVGRFGRGSASCHHPCAYAKISRGRLRPRSAVSEGGARARHEEVRSRCRVRAECQEGRVAAVQVRSQCR